MTKDFFLPRSRAAVAVLTMILLGACSDSVREPTVPGKALPKIHAQAPADDYSFQDGSQITIYDDEGGWSRLDVAARTVTDPTGKVVLLSPEETIAFLNDYQGTIAFDRLSNAVSGIPPCTDYCIEPTSGGTVPLGTRGSVTVPNVIVEIGEKVQVKTKATDKFGVQVVDLDRTLKEQLKLQKKSGGATTLEWPPSCGTTIVQVRAAKDEYISQRHSTLRTLKDIFYSVVRIDSNGNFQVTLQNIPGAVGAIFDRFFAKDLSQTKLSIMSALYTGACSGSLPIGTAGYGWYPGAVLECNEYKTRVSVDGGVHWFWATVRACSYHMA